jgi:hypothetical protein
VITSVSIANFRGVRQGAVEGLAPISILVGPNNMGKSTVLEAIALASQENNPSEAARLFLRRGGPVLDALDHVLHVGETEATIKIRNEGGDGKSTAWLLTISKSKVTADRSDTEGKPMRGAKIRLVTRLAPDVGQTTLFDAHAAVERIANPQGARRPQHHPDHEIFANDEGQLSFANTGATPEPFPSRLVDLETVREHEALEDAHASIGKAARLGHVVAALQRAMPGLTDLVIFKTGSKFVLHSVRGTAPPVPSYLAGDGFKRFLALAASVFGVPNGSVLLEEPESYQHPRYMQELVRLLHLAAREGTQIILSTHSMELIDMLLHAPEAEGKAYPAVHRMSLYDDKLQATTIDREAAVRVRDDLLQDLRA